MIFSAKKVLGTTSIDESEVRHFARDSGSWWDENGPFKPLHKLNPVRVSYIKRQICMHFGREFDSLKALDGLRILDIGCGGGLVCEPLARLGATLTGTDADAGAIATAQTHAQNAELSIDYQNAEFPDTNKEFDVVLALEVIEHTANPQIFLDRALSFLKPNGLMIVSTLSRTAKSYALGIIAAEYILRWVPRGTHHWSKLLKPSEIAALARPGGLYATDVTGLVFNPLTGEFSLSKTDLDVNYLMTLKWRV